MSTLFGKISLFGNIDYQGSSIDVLTNVADLRELHGHGGLGFGNWNDEISSFKITKGTWIFFEDVDYGGRQTQEFPPGEYRDCRDYGFPVNWISSFKIIKE